MSILSWYILRRHFGPFCFAIGVILFVFLTNFVMQNLHKLLGKGLDASVFLEVIALNLPWMLTLTIPMAVLIATLSAFGHLSKDNEIIAMRSGGVSPLRITMPVLVASCFIAWGTAWLNNAILPEANHRARLLMSDIYQTRPTLQFEEGIFTDELPRYRIMARRIMQDSPWMYDVTILDNSTPGLQRSIVADSGTIDLTSSQDRLTLTLYSGEIHDIDPHNIAGYQRMAFARHVVHVPVNHTQLERSQSNYRGDREKSATQLKADIEQLHVDIAAGERKVGQILQRETPVSTDRAVLVVDSLETLLAGGTLVENVDAQTGVKREIAVRHQLQQLKMQTAVLQSKIAYRSKLGVEYYKKYSIPLSCLAFVLIGAPLGMLLGRGSFGFSGGLSLVFYVIFWGFLTTGESLADRRLIAPFWAMWTANIIVGSAGVYLLAMMSQGSWLLGAGRIMRILRLGRQPHGT